MNIALIGPTGVGKGTHAAELRARFGLRHITSGDLLRLQLERGTALGTHARHYMDQSELVPDELVNAMIEASVRAIDPDVGTLFDGFPRTAYQAVFLDELLASAGRALDAVILLHAPDNVIVERLSGRLVCRVCRTPYHIALRPPKSAGVCDVCGGELYQRAEDFEVIVRRRLGLFRRATGPLLDHYARAQKLIVIPAEGPIETVSARLLAVLDEVIAGEHHFANRETAIRATELLGVAASQHTSAAKSLDIMLLGGPGSGKGTQAEQLRSLFQLPHIATGDLFRDNLKNDTELGRLAKSYMNRGDLVPDDVAEAMVEERLGRQDTRNGFVLDGFPRTVPQAEALDEMLNRLERRLAGVLYINVSDEAIIERLSGRLVCRACQAPYHAAFNPPKIANVCDLCGGVLYRRDDDNPDTVRARLRTFHGQTEPLIDYYSQAALLHEIEGEGEVTVVTKKSIEAVRRLARGI
ncbi:MAG TPA: adenylate kinase [Thermoflexales bacterium]|nr:adenylate kinase [Thermoflexales bacterium]